MGYENKILNLFKNGYLTTKDVVNNNIPRTYLTKLVKEGKIERISRGVYAKKNVLVDEFVVLQSKSKNAIYSNTTALYLYGFCVLHFLFHQLAVSHLLHLSLLLQV